MNLDEYHPLRNLVSGWIGKIKLAREHRQPFMNVADECAQFFCAEDGFMWKKTFKERFWKNDLDPKFTMTINKAFELVALFGPVLYARNPVRTVTPRQVLDLPPQVFGSPMDPAGMLMQQQIQAISGQEAAFDQARARLLGAYLNYTPNELPDGGLKHHAERAITEALVKGRGVLWTELHQSPGSQRKLIGSFYDKVDNLFIDPDASSLGDAKWIARRCVHPIWQVEREYGLPAGSLKGKGQYESASSQGETIGNDLSETDRKAGQTNDLLVYYKVYSKMGCGARLAGVNNELTDALDAALGDYCYLVIADSVDYPLNLPTDQLLSMTDADTAERTAWPIPFWRDERWPCSVLDFYEDPGKPWPIAPLRPGLGELKFLNVFISHLCNRLWSSCRDFIAVAKGASEEVKKILESGKDLAIIELSQIQGNINEIVAFLQQPQINKDVWAILSAVMEQFDKRVGLSELLYGLTARQMRSAAEAQARQEQINVRPDYMASKVEDFMTEAARLEGMAARWLVDVPTVASVLGPAAALAWQHLVLATDPDKVIGEMEYRIEAGSARKPNRDRDVANVHEALPMLLPVLNAHATATGDTRPVNSLIRAWGQVTETNTDALMMGPRMPPLPPPMPGAAPPPQGAQP